MSSFNSIEKIKYTETLSDAVSLDEYIIFGDERAERKYIVFKFTNNVNQQLLGMKFEVCQYDADNNPLEKTVVIYDRFLAKANAEFVPKARLKVQYKCRRISVQLLQAAFDRVLWNNGEYVDNSYKFEHYVRDQEYIEGRYERGEEKRVKPRTAPVPQSYKQYNGAFTIKNVMKKNIAKFPAVFYTIFAILLVLYFIASMVYLMLKTNKFTVDDFDMKLIGSDTVSIYRYEGQDTELTIPATVNGYRVRKIEKGAFRGSKITSLKLESATLIVEEYAFAQCSKLESVRSDGAITVQPNAFADCTALTVIMMEGSYLEKGSFSGCANVIYISFYDTNAAKVLDIFNEKQHAVRYESLCVKNPSFQ